MLKKLITFLQNNFPKLNIDNWLESKYFYLNDAQLKKIATAIKNKELLIKSADELKLKSFIFHFSTTLILVEKTKTGFKAELAWETDFFSIHSIRNKTKGFIFISFEFDKNYNFKIKQNNKNLETNYINTEKSENVINKVMPILQGFISAIIDE